MKTRFHKLPKVELHRHLELCLRPSTIHEWSASEGSPLSPEDFRAKYLITEPMRDLPTVLAKFLAYQKWLNSEERIERMAFEACEDAFKGDNIRILELRYSPTFIRDGHPNLSFEKIHASIVRGVQRAEKTYPMVVGLICTVQRILPVPEAEYVMDFAIANRDTFVGVDLADNEVGFDPKPFAAVFTRAKEAGLGITIHAGEADTPTAAASVRDAIEHLGADRIGHGLQIHRDPETMQLVRDNKICLELCPTSNWLTQAVRTVETHPFRKLLDFGITTTINSDDPGIFNITLNHEYDVLYEKLMLSEAQIVQCTEWAAQKSFIPAARRSTVWKTVEQQDNSQ